MRSIPRGWQSDPQYICIDRSTVWGNPYRVSEFGRATCIAKYEAYVRRTPTLLAKLPELNASYIVCHCHPLQCHGDVLVRLFSEYVSMLST